MNLISADDRANPEFAASMMERLCPSHRDRMLVMRLLLRSIEFAEKTAPDAWALTQFNDGFRLNVGPVEVMTFKLKPTTFSLESERREILELRFLLHGSISKELHQLCNNNEDVHEITPSQYKSAPQPQFVYIGSGEVADDALADEDYAQLEKAHELLFPLHADFIGHAARTSSGNIRKVSNLRRSHSPGLYIYAQSFVGSERTVGTTNSATEHFIAYHNAQRMGCEYGSPRELVFQSTKHGTLKKAIGNTVWVVQGIPDGKKTAYTLCGAYMADRIEPPKNPSSNVYIIRGSKLKEFDPPVPLNQLSWFPVLLNSQGNFGLGFNRISDKSVILKLSALLSGNGAPTTVPGTIGTDVQQFSDELQTDAHSLFQKWRLENPDGFFLVQKGEGSYLLHHVGCHHIGSPFWNGEVNELPGNLHSLTASRKICSSDSNELIVWLTDRGFAHGVCRHCVDTSDLSHLKPSNSAKQRMNGWQKEREISAPVSVNAEDQQAQFEARVQRSLRDSPDARRKRLANAGKTPIVVVATTKAYLRNPDVVAEVLYRASGQCERCMKPAPFIRKSDESPYLEVHHKRPLAKGGEDTVVNAIALCPNCHREKHFGIDV